MSLVGVADDVGLADQRREGMSILCNTGTKQRVAQIAVHTLHAFVRSFDRHLPCSLDTPDRFHGF